MLLYSAVTVCVELYGDEMMRGLGTEMPSVDDADDGVGDASLHRADDETEMRLVDSEPLYDSDSEADEENFTAGLSFDDDTTDRANNTTAVAGDALLGGILSHGQSTVLAALSSPAVSSLMTSAATGLTAIRDAVNRVRPPVNGDAGSDSDVLDTEFEFLNDDEFN